jgi:hypothetical protein
MNHHTDRHDFDGSAAQELAVHRFACLKNWEKAYANVEKPKLSKC